MSDEVRILVGKVPYRKRIALSLQEGGMVTVLAYFRDEESAQRFLAVMNSEDNS